MSDEVIRSRYVTRVINSRYRPAFTPNLSFLLEAQRRSTIISTDTDSQLSDSENERPASINETILSMMTATLGSGILIMPYSWQTLGPVLALVYLLVFGWLGYVSVHTYVRILSLAEVSSLEALSLKTFGPAFAYFQEICLIGFCFGTGVAYHFSIKSLTTVLYVKACEILQIPIWFALSKWSVLNLFLTYCVAFPIIGSEVVLNYKYLSLVALLPLFYLVVVMLILEPEEGFRGASPGWWPSSGYGALQALSTFAFAFCCQPNVPLLWSDLRNPTFARMGRVSWVATGVSVVLYMTAGWGGSRAWPGQALPSVLDNLLPGFTESDPAVILAYAGVVCTILISLPYNFTPVKGALDTILSHKFRSYRALCPQRRGWFLYLVVVSLSFWISESLADLGKVMALVGCTSGTMIAYVLPGLMYLKLAAGPLFCRVKWRGWVLLVSGCAITIVGVAQSLNLLGEPPLNSTSDITAVTF